MLEFLFRWDVVGVGIGVLATVGFGALALDDFKIAKVCFLLAAAELAGGIAMWGINTPQSATARVAIVAASFALIGILVVESIRYVDRKQSAKQGHSEADTLGQAASQSTSPQLGEEHGMETPPEHGATEDQSGPGPATAITDSVCTVVTPATPKGGAMIGGFTTTGSGEYEVPILHVAPEELLFTPPGRVLRSSELPAKLLISGHNLTILSFTNKGFVVNDNRWRDIPIEVALIKAAPPAPTPQPSAKTLEAKPPRGLKPSAKELETEKQNAAAEAEATREAKNMVHNFRMQVRDAKGHTASKSFTITVLPANTPLKEQALELSEDILEFLVGRNEQAPPYPKPGTWEHDQRIVRAYGAETMNLFTTTYTARVSSIRDELALKNLRDPGLDQLYEHPANVHGMRVVAEKIADLARRLP